MYNSAFVIWASFLEVSDQIRLKPAVSATETAENLQLSKFGYYTIQTANNKGADDWSAHVLFTCNKIRCSILPQNAFSCDCNGKCIDSIEGNYLEVVVEV